MSTNSSPLYNQSHYSSDIEDSDEEGSVVSYDSDFLKTSAQQQWENSLVQLSTLLNFVIIPLVGRMIGRRFSGVI